MRTTNDVAFGPATSTHADTERVARVDVYRRYGKPVCIRLWSEGEQRPYVAFRDSDDGRLVRHTVEASDGDVVGHDHHEVHMYVLARIFTFAQGGAVRGVALYRDQEAAPFLAAVGTGEPLPLYPFNRRSHGTFFHDFRDRDARPVSDACASSLRAVLHGRGGRDWPAEQTAELVGEFSSGQIARLLDVVKERSRDDQWRERFQDNGLAGSEELASMLSGAGTITSQRSGSIRNPLPLVTVEVEPNTFAFYVTETGSKKVVRIHQFTDFRGTSLEGDFPMGSSSEWRAEMPMTFSDMEAINAAGRSLLKDWGSLPKAYPAAQSRPCVDAIGSGQAERSGKVAEAAPIGALSERQMSAAVALIDEHCLAGQRQRETASDRTRNVIDTAWSLLQEIRGRILEGDVHIDISRYSDAHMDHDFDGYDQERALHLQALPELGPLFSGLDGLGIHVDHEHRVHNLSDDQRAAIAAFCDTNGRDWKEKLASLWMSGSYSRNGIGADQAALLQQVRNQLGPEWLVNVSRADLDGPRFDVDQDADLDM